MRHAAAALLPVLFVVLAGCADDSDLPVVSGACRMKQVAEVAVTFRRGLIAVPVRLNDRGVAMVLDTGSERSVVTADTVSRLALLADPRNGTLLSGVGGQGLARNDALIDDLRFATYDTGYAHLPVSDMRLADNDEPPLAGLLGAEVISHFDLDLDLAHRRIGVWRVGSQCQGAFLPWHAPYAAVPASISMRGQLLLPVTLEGRKLNALIDTGASTMIVDPDAATRAGVSDAALARDPTSAGFGAAGVDFHHTMHTFHELDIGPDRLRDISLPVLDRSLVDADMLLGLPYLRSRHIWLSYASEQVFIALPETASAGAGEAPVAPVPYTGATR